MGCLTKRDKAVLNAMLWRAKVNISRNKKGTLKALQMTLTMSLLVIAFKFLLKPQQLNVQAQNYVTVTSSGDLLNGTNFFVD